MVRDLNNEKNTLLCHPGIQRAWFRIQNQSPGWIPMLQNVILCEKPDTWGCSSRQDLHRHHQGTLIRMSHRNADEYGGWDLGWTGQLTVLMGGKPLETAKVRINGCQLWSVNMRGSVTCWPIACIILTYLMFTQCYVTLFDVRMMVHHVNSLSLSFSMHTMRVFIDKNM